MKNTSENEICRWEGDFATSVYFQQLPHNDMCLYSAALLDSVKVRAVYGSSWAMKSAKCQSKGWTPLLVSLACFATKGPVTSEKAININWTDFFSDQTLPLDVYGQEKHPDSENFKKHKQTTLMCSSKGLQWTMYSILKRCCFYNSRHKKFSGKKSPNFCLLMMCWWCNEQKISKITDELWMSSFYHQRP